jgi:hypothetical protein
MSGEGISKSGRPVPHLRSRRRVAALVGLAIRPGWYASSARTEGRRGLLARLVTQLVTARRSPVCESERAPHRWHRPLHREGRIQGCPWPGNAPVPTRWSGLRRVANPAVSSFRQSFLSYCPARGERRQAVQAQRGNRVPDSSLGVRRQLIAPQIQKMVADLESHPASDPGSMLRAGSVIVAI